MSTNAITTVGSAASLAIMMRPPPPVILDLDAHNFSQCSVHRCAILGCHGLLNHIDDSLAAAPTDLVWVQDDFAVITAMHGLISRDVLDIIQTDADGDMHARDLSKAAKDLITDNKDG
jgi:hypothetical protein